MATGNGGRTCAGRGVLCCIQVLKSPALLPTWSRGCRQNDDIKTTLYQRFFTEDKAGYGSAMSVTVIFLVSLLLVLALSARRRTGAAS